MSYDEKSLRADLAVLKGQGAYVFDIGYTELGRPIPCVMKGSRSGAQTLIVGTSHAREYITTPLVLEMMKNYSGRAGVWCVPMLNIDGALLCQYGVESVNSTDFRAFLLEVNGGSSDFSLWKANARAVDLNVNFNANWGTGKSNVTAPSAANYIGEYPVSESENIALRDLTLKIQPSVMLSYHTKGEVIFRGFGCINTYVEEAKKISLATGYPLLTSEGSAGGYKDWFVATTAKLGLTIEVVADDVDYPIPLELLPKVYERNKNVINIATNIAEGMT